MANESGEQRKMKSYVISLTTATDRREHIINEFGKQGIDFEFFDAITPDLIDQSCQTLNIDLNNTQLSPTEKACFLSHLMVMQKALDNHLSYVAIFEDDIHLGENAYLYFTDDNYLTKHNIDILKLETVLQYKKLDKKSAIICFDNRIIYRLNEYHLGTGGYIINYTTIKAFLAYIKSLSNSELIPIDRLLFDSFMKKVIIHQLIPALCIQEQVKNPNHIQLPSSLEQERKLQQKNKPKRTLLQKIKGELGNVFKKTIGKKLRTKIEFR